jgi:phosphate transport system substrate-binding protein
MVKRKVKFTVALLALSFFFSGCLGGKSKTEKAERVKVSINGAGATFPYPVYVNWAKKYREATGIRVNYQGIGSGGGIKQVTDRVVDFGGTDKILSPEELSKRKLYQFPALIGSIVVVYNLDGVGDRELKLSNKVVCDLFMGKIKFWDDPEIRADNPELKLPHRGVTVVHRAEGSGTTWNFTYWLSSICSEWKDKVGFGKAVQWPTGIGAKGNAGVTNYVRQTPGSVGYVEYAYKVQNKLSSAVLKTKSGKWVEPGEETFKEAASKARWSKSNHFYLEGNLILQDGDRSWPLTAATMILLPSDRKERNRLVIDFFDWSFKNGDGIAVSLGYVPLPEKVKEEIRSYWKDIVLK